MTERSWLIVGLGNPGPEYELTRHNAGFIAVDSVADSLSCAVEKKKFNGLYGTCRNRDERVILLKPHTYMNRSGISVAAALRFFKIGLDRLLVIHDDLDLVPGRIKVVARGGAGGHNGIRSLIRELGSRDFARLKIGIGRPKAGDQGRAIPVERYVLSRFTDQELADLEERLALVCQAVDLFIHQGLDRCMNEVNRHRA